MASFAPGILSADFSGFNLACKGSCINSGNEVEKTYDRKPANQNLLNS